MTPRRRSSLYLVAAIGLGLLAAAPDSRLREGSPDDDQADGARHGYGGQDPLQPQTVVYYNARIALREQRYQDVLKLWLLHNSLTDRGEEPVHDGDFRSAVWAAVAAAGLCHDGLRADDGPDGVGLWPLAIHNWLTKSSSRQPAPPQPRSFNSFKTGFQQRLVSLRDVLSADELRGIRFVRRDCTRPYLALAWLDTPHWLDLDDRLSVGIMMRDLVEKAQVTLQHERVRGQVVLETRLFDIDVALARLAKSKARRESGLLARAAKATGVSESAMTLMRQRRDEDVKASQYTALLRNCLDWSTMDWFSLNQNRRLALFRESIDTYADQKDMHDGLARTILGNIDVLIERKDGAELNQWLGFAGRRPKPDDDENTLPQREAQLALRERLLDAIALSDRGERLLALEPSTGFRERGVIALRRATDALIRGKTTDAMRNFAMSMQLSEESRAGTATHHLAKRWFAYVLSHHAANEEAMGVLREFVSPIDRNELLEILLWRAAFHADAESFERVVRETRKGGSLDFRVRLLRPLSQGDVGKMWNQSRVEFKDRPRGLYKFIERLTDELATETLDVRRANRVTLTLAQQVLAEAAQGAHKGLRRRMDEQGLRIQSLLDGLDAFDESIAGRVQAAAPGAPAYAGSVRLAPVDPLPWPFAVPLVKAPSPFTPIMLTPIEWLDDDGHRVFGWHLHEKGA